MREQKPHAWRDVAGRPRARVVLCPHGESVRAASRRHARHGSPTSPRKGERTSSRANRAWVDDLPRIAAIERGAPIASGSTPRRSLEKTLVDNNAYFVAKSLLLTRAQDRRQPRGRRQPHPARHPPQRPGRAVERAARSRSPSARPSSPSSATPRPPSPSPMRVPSASTRSKQCLRPHRGPAGHGAGGTDEGRPLQGRRAPTSFPYRAPSRARQRAHGRSRRAKDGGACRRRASIMVEEDRRPDRLLGRRRPAQAHRVRPHRPRLCLSRDEIEEELRRSAPTEITRKDLKRPSSSMRRR